MMNETKKFHGGSYRWNQSFLGLCFNDQLPLRVLMHSRDLLALPRLNLARACKEVDVVDKCAKTTAKIVFKLEHVDERIVD